MKDVQRFKILDKGCTLHNEEFSSFQGIQPQQYACVGLEETILTMACHHRLFGLAWDGCTQKLNKDGLNGTQAVADLVNDIVDTMKVTDYLKNTFMRPISVGCIYGVTPSFNALLNKKI